MAAMSQPPAPPLEAAPPPPLGLELQLLEKIELHIKVHVIESAYWETDGAVGAVGFDGTTVLALRSAGLPIGRMSMKLSPVAKVSIPGGSRTRYSIPEDATHFCFAYPLLELESMIENEQEFGIESRAVLFLHSGGFVYFDSNREVVRINALTLSRSRISSYFTGPNAISREAIKKLRQTGRMCSVTIDALQAAGMVEFGWINPLEELPGWHDVTVMDLDKEQLESLDDDAPREVKRLGQAPWPHGALVFSRRQGMEPVFFAKWSPPADSLDVVKWSLFERIARAATISVDELDTVLNDLSKSHTGREAALCHPSPDAVDKDVVDSMHNPTRLVHTQLLGAKSLQAAEEGHSVSPIMWASAEGIPRAVRNLLEAGARLDDAVEVALTHDNGRCAAILLRHRSCFWLPMLDPKPAGQTPKPAATRIAILSTVAGFVQQDPSEIPRQVTQVVVTQGVPQALRLCMQAMEEVTALVGHLIEREPSRASELSDLDVQLQLCAAGALALGDAESVDHILGNTDDGSLALEIALKREARMFLSQSVIQLYMARLWRGGVAFDVWSIVVLLVQLPLLIVVAIVPPLEDRLKRHDFYMLSAPFARFTTAYIFDLIFAAALTFATRQQLERSNLLWTLLLWASSMLLWELQQLARAGTVNAYASERFNRIDLPAAVVSLVALACIRADLQERGSLVLLRPSTRVLRSAAVLLLWLRAPRVFLLSTRRGPLVLMLFRMMSGSRLTAHPPTSRPDRRPCSH